MSGPCDHPPVKINSLPQSITAPLLLWLVLQLLALLLSAAPVALAARWPQPWERLALHSMVVVQFAGAGMLFPFLLRDRAATLACILTGGPMLQLAGFAAHASQATLSVVWACLAVWLTALGGINRSLRPGLRLAAVGSINFLTLGGPLLAYLTYEAGGDLGWTRWFPLCALLLFLEHGGWHLAILPAATVCVAALGVRWASGRKWKRHGRSI